MKTVYIVDGARTPFLKSKGVPGMFSASDLAVSAGKELINRNPIAPDNFDEVIMGCVSPEPNEANIARIIALRLGCGHQMPAFTVQRNCASGMQALDSAFLNIASGRSDLVLAGGTEAMSRSPVLYNNDMVNWLSGFMRAKTVSKKMKQLTKLKMKYLQPVFGLKHGLTDPLLEIPMGQTAENVANMFSITRQEMDEYAVQSHLRLENAQNKGYFENEIVPIFDANGNLYDRDNGLRVSSIEEMARLKPAFTKYGNVTAGNSAQITDGACVLMLASESAVEQYNLEPLGVIKRVSWAGVNPAVMGLGPVHSTVPLMNYEYFEDIDYWELNEAFAAQVLGCKLALNDVVYLNKHFGFSEAIGSIPNDRLNVDGGGISQGHPVGASGARITLHLLNVLKRNNAKKGIATMCIGAGQGGSVLVETV